VIESPQDGVPTATGPSQQQQQQAQVISRQPLKTGSVAFDFCFVI
jgi:hypothetical protein